MKKILKWCFILIALFGVAFPMAAAIGAGFVASYGNCKLDEGSVHPCLIGGVDTGPMLYQVTVLGMVLGMVGASLLVWVGIGWGIVSLVSRFASRRTP